MPLLLSKVPLLGAIPCTATLQMPGRIWISKWLLWFKITTLKDQINTYSKGAFIDSNIFRIMLLRSLAGLVYEISTRVIHFLLIPSHSPFFSHSLIPFFIILRRSSPVTHTRIVHHVHWTWFWLTVFSKSKLSSNDENVRIFHWLCPKLWTTGTFFLLPSPHLSYM